ncbi:hypothetical protein LAZ67_10002329 [Cordylochernes scorpioides]|uniref:Uncharacterized protein n=1 Tax=Cordylochernes scorpioides TaxID=51811 RepID=A0ABY6L1H9_9ARAC|nr:hypothetical protein LAZ67_10002329 [Cordylochernes scorpioides]
MSNCVSTKACLETLLVKVWGPKGIKVVRAVIDIKDLGVPIMGEEELEIFGGISRKRCGRADINQKIATANMIRLLDDPIARETLLGWVVQGKTVGNSRD